MDREWNKETKRRREKNEGNGEEERERKKDPVLFAFALKSVWCVLFLSRSHALPQNVRSTCFSFFFSKQAKIVFVHRMSIECAYLFALRWRSVGQKTIKKRQVKREGQQSKRALLPCPLRHVEKKSHFFWHIPRTCRKLHRLSIRTNVVLIICSAFIGRRAVGIAYGRQNQRTVVWHAHMHPE